MGWPKGKKRGSKKEQAESKVQTEQAAKETQEVADRKTEQTARRKKDDLGDPYGLYEESYWDSVRKGRKPKDASETREVCEEGQA